MTDSLYRQFEDVAPPPPGEPLPRVCIVTSELVGPFKNGGIGTSMTGMAETLAGAGFPVAVFYTGALWSGGGDLESWRQRYERIGIELVWPSREALRRLAGPVADCGFGSPYLVYEFLRQRPFDVVHFNDCLGEGFYCLAMKRLGAMLQDTLVCVALHSPSQWVYELDRTTPATVIGPAFNYAERLSTRCADLVWSPSRYLLDWTRARGFKHPAASYVQQYVIPTPSLFAAAPAAPAACAAPDSWALETSAPPREIVFFARLEERKGIRIFCSALGRLNDLLAERGVTVTFLGKHGQVGDVSAYEFLKRQAAGWRFAWKSLTDVGQPEAVAYLRSRPAVAVIASPEDNSPCTIYEALTFGLPFVAARTGGIPELIHPADHDAVLFDVSSEALAAKLAAVLDTGSPRARPAWTQEVNQRRWIGAMTAWRTLATTPAPPSEPLRRVCAVVDWTPGADLAATLASLAENEVVARIVILNRAGAAPPATAASATTRIVDLEAESPSALPAILGADRGEAVLMVRAGVRIAPAALSGLLEALRRDGPDGLIPAAATDGPEGPQIAPPLGGSQAFSFYEGLSFTGGLIAKAERLAEACQDARLALDTEFLGLADLAVTAGLALWPYAAPVFQTPSGRAPRRRARMAQELLAAYGRADAVESYYIAAIAESRLADRSETVQVRKVLRSRLTRLRLGWAVKVGRRILPAPVAQTAARLLRRPLAWALSL